LAENQPTDKYKNGFVAIILGRKGCKIFGEWLNDKLLAKESTLVIFRIAILAKNLYFLNCLLFEHLNAPFS
jgi:hypothetical protein